MPNYYEYMIGGPLKACIEAQEAAKKTAQQFYDNVGITYVKKDTQVIYQYEQNGKIVQTNVPIVYEL
jgi:hypothetical protein